MPNRSTRLMTFLFGIVATLTITGLTSAAAPAAPAVPEMTLTFVRHAESHGNASGMIDTSTPGPTLTDLGRIQARQVAKLLSDSKFDGVYASRMERTLLTAQPTARVHHRPVAVEPGFHEILAGDHEGQPESEALEGYFQAPMQWLRGNLEARIPGAENGFEFKDRVDHSVAEVAAEYKKNAVVFSHGGTIMIWSILSASNAADYASKLQNDPLHNVGRVVLKGNPSAGWRIVEWVGSPDLPDVADCGSGSLAMELGSLAPC